MSTTELTFFDQYKSCFNTNYNPELVDNGSLFGLNKWFSCRRKNLNTCSNVQRYLDSSRVNKDIVKAYLFYGINKDNPYIEYYLKKKSVKEDKKLLFLKDMIRELYTVSKEEFDTCYWQFIENQLKDEKFVSYLVDFFGLNYEESKCLGFKRKQLTNNDIFEKEVDLFG